MSGGPPSDAVVLISGGRAPPHQKQSSSQSSPVVVPSPSHSTPKRRKLLVPRRRGGSGGDLRACWGGGSGGEGTMPATAAADVAISAPIAAAAHHRHHHPHHHHGSVRQHHVSARALADITPRFTVGASGGNADLDLHRASGGVSSVGASGGSVRITHLVSAVSGTGGSAGGHATSGVTANAASGAPRFPKLDECAHFHYENVELGPVQVSLCEEELKPLSDPDGGVGGNENRSWVVQVTSLGRSWLLRRSYDNFRMLDSQLHRCVYDRKFSALPELPPEANVPTANPDQPIEEAVRCLLTEYLSRLTCLAGGGSGGNTTGSASLINCGPVLNWLELDNRGHRLLVTDDSDINTPAVAAAYAVRRYTAQAPDEISFEVGDMISVIDMPPPEESIWWRGKRGFEVGFFPCECVALIGEKVPRSLLHQLVPASSQQPSASPPSIAAATGPSSPPGTAPAVVTPASSCASTASSSPSPASSAIVVASPSSQPGRPLPSKPVLRKHGKLIAFFRSFILSRPSRRRLKQSGILKERVFGCDLGEHLLNSGHEIPMVLKCCAEFIETNGIVDGIYRLSGVTSNIQKLRNAFDEDRVPGLYEDEAILQDIHSVASLLKMYFRELPNPLCTYHLYHRFVGAVQAPHENRLALMREVVKSLPPPHYRTLEYLMKHLARVAQRGGETGMTPRNVAIVWAPNLLRCKELEVGGVAALQGVGVQAVVTEFLVCYADLIFGAHEKGALAQRLRQRPGQHLSPEQHKLPPDVSPNLVAAFAAENATPKRSRPKSLAISTPTKLLSLEEARTRALLAATGKADQEYIEVGGGPANLPAKYHTVIDVPARKRGSLKSKRSPGLGWKAFFSKKIPLQQRQQSSSSLTSKRNILGGGFSPGASGATASSQLRGMVSPSELRTQEKAMTESDLMQSKRRLRPVKSAESLSSAVASAGSSTRNSAALDLEIGLGSIEGVLDQITGQSSSAMIGDTGLPSSPSVTGKPSHSRSVSHDSYFDHLAEPVLLMTEEEDAEREEEGDLGESENLEGLLDLSEIQLDFELEEREMRIFSEDETLVSTTPIGSGGSLSRSPLLPHPTRRRLIGSPQGSGPRARPEDTGSSADPSPKKKKSGASTISPGARKRSKVETKSQATATSSSPSPVSSPGRPGPLRPPSSSMPSVGQRSCFGADDEDEEEELRFIDSQSPEPLPPSTTSFHRTSPTSYMSRQSSHSPSSNHNHYSQPYQQQQVVVHAEVHPSPSEDASSLSRADATVSDNESFTVHGGETSSEGDLPAEAAGAHPENEEEEDDEDEGGVLYTPLVNDATAETTPVEQSTPAYENVPWVRGALNGDDQITSNLVEKRKCPAATPRNLDSAPIGRVYQNVGSSYSDNHDGNNDEAVYEEVQVIKDKSDLQRTTSPISSVTRRNDVSSSSLKNNASKNGETDPEEVYQQVKAFRKSVQEVNEILGGASEQTQLPKMEGQQNKTVRSEDSVQNSREASSAGNEQCAIVKEVSANSELLSSSNGSSEESSEGRVPSEEMALLRTPSGRSGLSVSGNNRRASLPASSSSSFTEDSHRRRFDSEIGRDILRERRVKLELERVRGEPGSGVSSPVSSDGTGTRLTPSPVSTPQRTLSPAPPKSPASLQTSERHSPAPSASSASTMPPRSPVPPQSPAPARSPAPSSSPVPCHSPAPSRSPAFSHSSAPARSPAPSSSSALSHSPAPVHSPVPSHSPLPPHSPVPSCSPVFSRSPAPPLSPASPHSPAPPISPASPHSPLPTRSPLSPLPPYSPITHSPALSPISPLNSPSSPKSPSYPIALSPTNSVNSSSHVASTSVGASCLRSPTIPMDLPSGPNSSSSSPARTPFKKNDESHRSVSVGASLTDVTADGVKTSSAKKDSAIKTLENGFEGGCRGWGSEGGSLRGLPGRSWSVSDSRRLAVRKASVRELLSRFEGKEGGEEEEKGGRRASAPSHRRPTPPCLRARASRSSPASALSVSLDEERFLASAREATNSPSKSGEIPTCNESPSKGDGQLIRVRTSPDINTEADDSEEQSLLMEQQSDSTEISNNKVESSDMHSSQTKMETSVGLLQTFSGPDDPERRERIERYKRERRSFLREKYRSESFREERDEVLKRLKQKVSSVPQESREVGSEGECRSRRRTRCTVTEADPVDDESKSTTGKLSNRSRWRATSSESDEAGEGVSRVGVSPVLSRSPNCRYGGIPASPTLSVGTPWDVAALFEAREQREKVEKGEKSRELP